METPSVPPLSWPPLRKTRLFEALPSHCYLRLSLRPSVPTHTPPHTSVSLITSHTHTYTLLLSWGRGFGLLRCPSSVTAPWSPFSLATEKLSFFITYISVKLCHLLLIIQLTEQEACVGKEAGLYREQEVLPKRPVFHMTAAPSITCYKRKHFLWNYFTLLCLIFLHNSYQYVQIYISGSLLPWKPWSGFTAAWQLLSVTTSY